MARKKKTQKKSRAQKTRRKVNPVYDVNSVEEPSLLTALQKKKIRKLREQGLSIANTADVLGIRVKDVAKSTGRLQAVFTSQQLAIINELRHKHPGVEINSDLILIALLEYMQEHDIEMEKYEDDNNVGESFDSEYRKYFS